jgi:hypothetical protein
MAGVLDRQSLARFIPGLTYDVVDSLGRQLISMGGARETLSEEPALVIRINDDGPDEAELAGGLEEFLPPGKENQ